MRLDRKPFKYCGSLKNYILLHLSYNYHLHMRNNLVLSFIIVCFSIVLVNGQHDLKYYLPDINYDKNIPTPKQYLGFEVGDWHVSHDQLLGYFKALDAASPLIELKEYARSHEGRQLVYAIITSSANHKNLNEIKESHAKLSDHKSAGSVDISNLPAILYQGYTIHGNEPSGNNGALLVAYYLVAGQSKEVANIRDNAVILLDPCLNPDGVQRFSTWVNSHKGINEVADPVSRELNEAWPGGRYNHYWFDMNRDWLPLVHPESRGRINTFHEWHPNVLTDHHEMGTNSTFFFQPGVPSSVNPNTPWQNQILTEEIGKFHAKALDSIGSQYFTKSRFDDFYYGKGSTYPDGLGCIGILFEQGSSRGHQQESINGIVTFPFTIRNQVTTSLSTQKATVSLRKQLLEYKKNFFNLVFEKTNKQATKGYIFTDSDEVKLGRFLDLLRTHHVEVYSITKDLSVDGAQFSKSNSYIVPLIQNSPVIAKTIFEDVKSFQDSAFYDVSGWTPAHAYNLTFKSLTSTADMSKYPAAARSITGSITPDKAASYAYAITLDQQNAHAVLYALQSKDIIVKHNQENITYTHNEVKFQLPLGTLIIPVVGQKVSALELYESLKSVITALPVSVYALNSGNSVGDIALGHPSVKAIDKPTVAIIVGTGIVPMSAGEAWYHCDVELGIPATLLELNRFRSTTISRYNKIVMPEGNYNSLSDGDIAKLKDWVGQGNTLICIGSAAEWAIDKGIIVLKEKENQFKANPKNYDGVDRENDAKLIGGSIFKSKIDLTHPLFYGYKNQNITWMHSGTRFFNPSSNAVATPALYTSDYQVSGYVPKGTGSQIGGSVVVTTGSINNGRIIAFLDNPIFRGYWYSGMKAFNNALFFGRSIERGATGN